MDMDPENLPEFKMPAKLLDKLYDLSGSNKVGKGILMAYLTQDGMPVIFGKQSSKIVEMGLRKGMESYLEELSAHGIMPLGYDLNDDDDLEDS